MKKLKELLKESIDVDYAEKRLKPWSTRVSGISGPSLEYIKTLEAVLSYLAPTSSKTNAKFDKFVKDRLRRQKSAEKMAQQSEPEPVGELPKPEETQATDLSSPETKPEVGPETEPEVKPEPIKGPPPPAKKSEPETDEKLPDLKTLASKGRGSKPQKKKSIELDLSPEKNDSLYLKKLKGFIGNAAKQHVLSTPLGGKAKLKKVDTGSFDVAQDWSVGQKVKVGFTDGLLVVGGNSSSGWLLAKGEKKYLFVPSATPKMGRGLYRIS